jgi:hypothetical protein
MLANDFQSCLLFLILPNGILQSKVENRWQKYVFFDTIVIGKQFK